MANAAPAPNVKRTLFCETCDNVLYPVQRESNQLLWNCRLCDADVHMPEGQIYVVHQADIKRSEEADSKALESLRDYTNDKTVMRATGKQCPKCNCTEAAWFINPLTKTDHDMTIYFACVKCQHVWIDPKRKPKDQ